MAAAAGRFMCATSGDSCAHGRQNGNGHEDRRSCAFSRKRWERRVEKNEKRENER